MALDKSQQKEIMDLVVLSLEGVAEPDNLAALKMILDGSDDACNYYIQALSVVENIRTMDWNTEMPEFQADYSDSFNREFWSALAEHEKTAPAIDVPKEEPSEELIQKVVYVPREKRKISKFNLFTFVTSAAAVLFFILFVKFAPERPYSIEVATLADQVNVKWAQPDTTLKIGSRLWTNGGVLHLQKGIVELRYDNGVDVLVEGPAAFEIDRLGVFIEYGRLYSRVSQSGLGFTVQTPTSQFVDQGTEFGVQADVNGSSELHVIKGKVQLFAGSSGDGRTGQMVTENNAVRFDANSKQIKTIAVAKNGFVRQVDSVAGIVWRGQAKIDLADVAGGGNGFGTGQFEIGINPLTGTRGEYRSEDRSGERRYIPVTADRYIDGVFVPQGNSTEIISSKGHVFKDCPQTNGLFYSDIINGYGMHLFDYQSRPPQGQLGGRSYGTKEYPSIFMHANLGITFDLDAFRKDLPGVQMSRFTSDAGLSSDAPRQGNADIWVLVDGELRFSQKGIREKDVVIPIDIKLEASDRFLTLIVTDGGDVERADVQFGRATDSDWIIFAAPQLRLSD